MIQLIIAGILLLTGILMMIYGGDKRTSTTGWNFNIPSLTQLIGFAIFVSGIPCGIFGLISLI